MSMPLIYVTTFTCIMYFLLHYRLSLTYAIDSVPWILARSAMFSICQPGFTNDCPLTVSLFVALTTFMVHRRSLVYVTDSTVRSCTVRTTRLDQELLVCMQSRFTEIDMSNLRLV